MTRLPPVRSTPRRSPLPQFKIIDFGIAKLSEKLARAAGGRESLVRQLLAAAASCRATLLRLSAGGGLAAQLLHVHLYPA